MSCILRAGGTRFDVDRCLKKLPLQAVAVHRKGAPYLGRPGAMKNKASHLAVVVSEREMTDFDGQARDAVRFLAKNQRAMRLLKAFSGVTIVRLDFGVAIEERRFDTPYTLPERLVRLAGNLGLSLTITVYDDMKP
jgi:hypothetical protein